jgi:hypothetical protein
MTPGRDLFKLLRDPRVPLEGKKKAMADVCTQQLAALRQKITGTACATP